MRILSKRISVSIMARLRNGRPGNRISIPGRDKRCFRSAKRPEWQWSPPSLVFTGYRGHPSPGDEAAGRQVDHSPPSITAIKDEWTCITTTLFAFPPYTGITSYTFCSGQNLRLKCSEEVTFEHSFS